MNVRSISLPALLLSLSTVGACGSLDLACDGPSPSCSDAGDDAAVLYAPDPAASHEHESDTGLDDEEPVSEEPATEEAAEPELPEYVGEWEGVGLILAANQQFVFNHPDAPGDHMEMVLTIHPDLSAEFDLEFDGVQSLTAGGATLAFTSSVSLEVDGFEGDGPEALPVNVELNCYPSGDTMSCNGAYRGGDYYAMILSFERR